MRPFESYASREFWELYRKLPDSVQKAADKQFALLSGMGGKTGLVARFCVWRNLGAITSPSVFFSPQPQQHRSKRPNPNK
jgi:hypothetical protein